MIKAIIFDMDGVITDAQTKHAIAESQILERCDIHISPNQIIERFSGMDDEDMFAQIFQEHEISGIDISKILEEKWKLMAELIDRDLNAVPGILDLLVRVRRRGIKTAIASATPRVFIKAVLEKFNISQLFEALVSSQDVDHGKPAPDIFLLAAKKLDAAVEDCLVIEDAVSGMIGAKAAGMRVIGYSNSPSAHEIADYVTEDFTQLHLDKVLM